MATIAYRVTKASDMWSILRDGELGMNYLTQEAAFEVAVSEASADVRAGHDIVIEVTSATDLTAARPGGGVPIEGDNFSSIGGAKGKSRSN